jgi:hypothetical protein
MHTLLLRLISEAGTVITEQRIRFFTGNRRPAIELLETYPPEALPPRGKGIVVPRISGAESAWLRWSRGGEVLAAGEYDRFRDGFVWTAPRETGVYSLRLELFPAPPPPALDGSYPFTSPISSETQFFVSTAASGTSRDLGPKERYRHLLHFNGESRDVGYEPAEFSFAEAAPRVAIREGLFGYQFIPGTRLVGRTALFPAGREGGIAPSTLTFRYIPSGQQRGSRLLQVLDAGGRPFFRLAYDSAGVPYLELEGVDERITADLAAGEKTRELAVSLIPLEERLQVRWYHNGRHISSGEYPYLPVAPPQNGRTLVGGEEGFRGLLYELGLYSRNAAGAPAADPHVLRRYVEQRYGSKEIYRVDGYEGEHRTVRRGEESLRVPADSLEVSPGQERELFALQERWRRLETEIELTEPLGRQGYLYFAFSDGKRITLRADGSVAGGSGSLGLDGAARRISFLLSQEGDSLVIAGEGGPAVRTGEPAAALVAVGIGMEEAAGEQAPALQVESLRVLRATDKLTEKEQKPEKKIES